MKILNKIVLILAFGSSCLYGAEPVASETWYKAFKILMKFPYHRDVMGRWKRRTGLGFEALSYTNGMEKVTYIELARLCREIQPGCVIESYESKMEKHFANAAFVKVLGKDFFDDPAVKELEKMSAKVIKHLKRTDDGI